MDRTAKIVKELKKAQSRCASATGAGFCGRGARVHSQFQIVPYLFPRAWQLQGEIAGVTKARWYRT